MLSALLATGVVLLSIGLLLFLLAVLLGALLPPLGGALERRRFRRLRERERRGDSYLEAGDIEHALREFRLAFYLEPIFTDHRLLAEVHNHHTGLLSRFVAVTDEIQGGTVRLISLAQVDRLLAERTELQRLYFSLRQRRRGNSRRRDVYVKLRKNRRQLQTCLQQLADEILASRPVETYH